MPLPWIVTLEELLDVVTVVAGVVAVTGELCPEAFPAGSVAETVYVYVVEGDRPVSE